jgi:hypothetical protein
MQVGKEVGLCRPHYTAFPFRNSRTYTKNLCRFRSAVLIAFLCVRQKKRDGIGGSEWFFLKKNSGVCFDLLNYVLFIRHKVGNYGCTFLDIIFCLSHKYICV